MAFLSGTARSARAFAFVLLLSCLALLWPGLASAANTSTLCGPFSVHVPSGGSVPINVTACARNINFAGDGPVDGPALPQRGSAILRIAGSSWFVDYSHNGLNTVGDVFEFSDTDGNTVTVTMIIDPPASSIVVSPAVLDPMTAGTSFSQTLSATGGASPYTYAINGGQLPQGLALNSNGTLSGTPTRRGAVSFTVRATDNLGAVVDKAYALTVQNPSLSITPTAATAVIGNAFSLALNGSGGVAPYTYAVESGALPPGITFNGVDTFSGTPSGPAQAYPLTLRITDNSAGAAPYYELKSFTLTVSNAPTVSINVSPSSVAEDSGTPLVYTVTRSASQPTAMLVNLTLSGTAASGTDYTGAVSSVTIPANATSATFNIVPVADTQVESDETVIFTVAAGAGYTVGAPASATGTIVNDDFPVATVSVSPATVNENGGVPLVYTISLDRPNPVPLSIAFTLGGTGASGTDYTAVSSPLVIGAGATSATVSIAPIPDAIPEPDKTVVLTLAPGAGYQIGAPASATGTLRDDDLPGLSINDVSANEGDSGTTGFTFTVSLNAPAPAGGVSFDIATANGTATAGSDYVARSLVAQTIPAGSQTYSFVVQVNGDTLHELNEDFFVNVTNVSGATLTDGQGRGTIINDDAAPSLSIADINVTEGNSGTTPAVLTVTLSAASALPVQVQYATANVTAVAPTDYTAASGTLSFPPGTTTQTITVLVNGDTTVEPDETFQVNLSNPVNASVADGSAVVTIVSDDAPVVVGPTVLPTAKAGVAYSQTFSATGGTGSYTYALSGTLPTGLTFNTSTGTLSGTPTQAGTFSFSVSATDSSPTPNMGTAFYGLIVSGPTLALPGAALPAAVRGQPFSSNRGPVSGGNAPYTFSVTGVLPTGLAISPNGVISGTPTAVGTFNFTVVARDSTSGTGAPFDVTENLTITVAESLPLAGNSTLSVGFNAPAANVALILSGGPATSLTLAAAPTHGTALVTGPTTISYQPATGYAGSDSFSYTATGPGGTSTPATVTVTVADPTITIGASGGFTAVAGMPYSQTFTWSGGSAPFSGYQVSNLPAGLSVTATTANSATVSGTPTASGTFNINASARDSSTGNGPYTVGQLFSLVVAGPSLSATPAVLPTATAGNPYQQAITATGGIAPYQVALTGTLPVGMSFNAASGTLSGTPTQSGTFALSATITDSTGGTPASITQSYSLVVASPSLSATPAVLPAATAGNPYQQAITATGGIAPYQVALTGTLPVGMSFNAASGTLSGTPTQSGTFALSATITDSTGGTPASITQSYSLVVASPSLSATPAVLPAATAGNPYQQVITATGGIAPYHVVLSGSLPAGMTFDAASGTLSGTPTQSGTFALSATITDSTGGTPASLTQSYSLVVASPVLVATPGTLAGGTAGSPYQMVFTASGGIAPYHVALSGTLPAGLSFDAASATLSGTPTQSGSFTVSATITDSTTGTPARLVQAYTLTIAAPALSLTPVAGALPASTAGSSYTLAFATTGGLAPYRYTLASGALPAGLVLDASTGRVAGTPSVAGSFGFSVAVSDATTGGAGSATQAYTLNVSAPVLTLTPSALPAGLFGHRYEQRLAAAGGTAPYRYVLSAGALPDGVTLEPAGGLAGTPTAAGAFAFTITATDALGFSGSHDYVVQIAPRPDPSRDPEVRGLLSAQRDAARRFANSQIENLQQRMQRLHGASRSNGFSNNLSLSYAPRRCEPMVGNVPGPDCDAQRRQPFDREPAPAVSDPAANSQAPLGLWVGGTIRSGRNEGGQRSGVDFETDGVTIGADRRLSDTLAVGAALGYGRDRSDVGERGSRSDGQAYSMALYASYSLGRSLFVDALVGHQLLDYTLRRYVTADGSFAHARRNGSQWFGSLAFGADLARGDWQFTPYARLDASQGSLDRYAEQGSDLFALRYGSQDVDATTGNAGLRVEVRRVARWGAWTPQLRVEYQHDFSGSGVATLQYADLGELPFYRTTLDGFDRNRWVLGAGVMFDFGRNWGLKVDYRGLVGSDDDRDHGVQISLDKQL
ncbi:putative Ig domain-containing protein [Stenotrophomonas maltophilia]|uniref:putative Ig domain-containing protein n=1 Tax=Stenotrophomonas sp. GD04024 TaxID=2975422 RepID=UPI00244AE363|nr:putative Ig domain-containing protein [Stenotrophomonas sp. GD04024]MDG9986551.1 putative Ig domain-containing protein [Stenotrophomonas sp. GD04024]